MPAFKTHCRSEQRRYTYAARTIARTHVRARVYKRPSDANGYFDGDLCSSRWKSRRRSFSPFAGLPAEILSARVNIYMLSGWIFSLSRSLSVASDRFFGLHWLKPLSVAFIRERAAVVNCAGSASPLKQLNFYIRGRTRGRDRANCARKNDFISDRERRHNAICYSDFGGVRPLFCRRIN